MGFTDKLFKSCLAGAAVLFLTAPLTASALARKGDPAPPIKVVSTSGQHITLANYKGSVLLVDFFATWCAPCRDAIPRLVDLNRRYGKQGLQILGLSADDEGGKILRDFIVERKINYPVALAGEAVLNDYGLRSIPTMFVIDKRGVVAEKYMGYNESMEKSIEALIKKLLAEN